MKTKLLILLFLAGSSLFAKTRVSIGVGIGLGGYGYNPYGYAYVPPPPVVVYEPVYYAPAYTWAPGYYYPAAPQYYYARPAYRGARWVAPKHYKNRYYRGYRRR